MVPFGRVDNLLFTISHASHNKQDCIKTNKHTSPLPSLSTSYSRTDAPSKGFPTLKARYCQGSVNVCGPDKQQTKTCYVIFVIEQLFKHLLKYSVNKVKRKIFVILFIYGHGHIIVIPILPCSNTKLYSVGQVLT